MEHITIEKEVYVMMKAVLDDRDEKLWHDLFSILNFEAGVRVFNTKNENEIAVLVPKDIYEELKSLEEE